ncbi:MAG: hypothetical protein ACE5IR_08020 [bacterium]
MPHLGGSTGHPPGPADIEDQREIFLPAEPCRFYPFDLGVAFGIAAFVFFLFMVIISLAHDPPGMEFFVDVFPGFTLATVYGIIIGLIWSFATGFVLGTMTGFVYNYLLRHYVVRVYH